MMRARRTIVLSVSCLLGLLAGFAIFVASGEGGRDPVPPPAAGADALRVRADLETAPAPGESSPGERATVGADKNPTTLGVILLQVEEIDRCIDPRGSELTLRDARTGTTHTRPIGEEGGTIFESIPIGNDGSDFEILTGIEDRRCFPATFTVRSAELEGDPPSFALSVALIHDHALRGRVIDATTGRPISGATVAVDSFASSSAASDEAGRFSLALPEPRGSLFVRAPGFQELFWAFPEARADGSTWLPSEREFELVPDPLLSIVEIEATFPDGSPAAHAELTVEEGSDVAYAAALADFANVGQRDRYLDRIAREIDAIGRVTTPEGDAPSRLDENGRATLRFSLPCAVRLHAAANDHVARADLVLAPRSRRTVLLSLAPAARIDVEVSGIDESFVGRVAIVEDGRPLASAASNARRSRIEFDVLPAAAEVTVIALGDSSSAGSRRAVRGRARVTTNSDSTPSRVALRLEPLEPDAVAPPPSDPAPAPAAPTFDLLIRVLHADGGELRDGVEFELRSLGGARRGRIERDALGSLSLRLPASPRAGAVSARRALLGDVAPIESDVAILALKPLRRIRVVAVDRSTGDPVPAIVAGVDGPGAAASSPETFVPCGEVTTITVSAPGYRPTAIPIGDGDGIPWLRVALDR